MFKGLSDEDLLCIDGGGFWSQFFTGVVAGVATCTAGID